MQDAIVVEMGTDRTERGAAGLVRKGREWAGAEVRYLGHKASMRLDDDKTLEIWCSDGTVIRKTLGDTGATIEVAMPSEPSVQREDELARKAGALPQVGWPPLSA